MACAVRDGGVHATGRLIFCNLIQYLGTLINSLLDTEPRLEILLTRTNVYNLSLELC